MTARNRLAFLERKIMFKTIKTYLLERSGNVTAWMGVIGIILELFTHLIIGASVLMLVFFSLAIIFPEKRIREIFAQWTSKISGDTK